MNKNLNQRIRTRYSKAYEDPIIKTRFNADIWACGDRSLIASTSYIMLDSLTSSIIINR